MRISNNLLAFTAQNNLKIITKEKVKDTEKLSSGYRINRAADDAVGLAISEKLRHIMRGVHQGTQNAEEGVSYSQVGDGALEEVQEMLHRMTVLTVKSLNGTNSDSDRHTLEDEFENLQSELDRIMKTTEFNNQKVFEQHSVPYYQCEGDVKWDPHQMHVVTDGKNDLTFSYRKQESDSPTTVTITVPQGEYTTQELVDEIDNQLFQLNQNKDVELNIEFTMDGYCNANLEGGEVLDSISGNMSYLLYQMFRGGGYGALIGTTIFPTEYSSLGIVTGENDELSFTINELQGGSSQKKITIPPGYYTRSELIDYLNEELKDTSVKATAYGSGIRLASEEAIVTGFKGNMFKIDEGKYTSVFYDNVKYGKITKTHAEFQGGLVLPLDERDAEHAKYVIRSSNNQLTLQPNDAATPVILEIPEGEYNADEMVQKLNQLFHEKGINLTAGKRVEGGYAGIKIVSNEIGFGSSVGLDENSSAYDTLFVNRIYNSYKITVNPYNETKDDVTASFTGSKKMNDLSSTNMLTIDSNNDTFDLFVDGTKYTIKLTDGSYASANDLAAEIDAQLNGNNAVGGLKGKVRAYVNSFNEITLAEMPGQKLKQIEAKATGGNDGFETIFQGYNISTTARNESGSGTVELNTKFDGKIDDSNNTLTIRVNGTDYNVTLPKGDSVKEDEIKTAISQAIPEREVENNITFQSVYGSGDEKNKNFDKTASGTTKIVTWNGSAVGKSTSLEGMVGYKDNEPAVLKIDVALKVPLEVNSSNNEITLKIKNQEKVITLDSATYIDMEQLKEELQKKIDEAFGTSAGGAIVTLSGNKLVLTARMPEGENGAATSISCGTDTSSFLRELNTTREVAIWTSTNKIMEPITFDNSNNEFVFQYTENGVSQDVKITFQSGKVYKGTDIVATINEQLNNQNVGVKASLYGSNYLRLVSDEKGKDVQISYNTVNGGTAAEVLFGPLIEKKPAQVVTDTAIQEEITIVAGDSDLFRIEVNGVTQTVTLDAGTYKNRSDFLVMLNSKLKNIGVEAYLSDNKLGYKTMAEGKGNSISINYDNTAQSAMKVMYGTSKTIIPGISAEFNNGYLTLSASDGKANIYVKSESGGPFQTATVTKTALTNDKTTGYHSEIKGSIDGVDLQEPLYIDEWNNTLKFMYTHNGGKKEISIEIPEKGYTFHELQLKMQELIDAQAGGSGRIVVTVDGNGVKLETVNTGTKYKLTDFKGDFYDKVIGQAEESRVRMDNTIKSEDGKQIVDSAYTIGRKDVNSKTTKIQSGISDELSFDLKYGNTTHTLTMKLDGGEYTANELKKHLQEKVNEQLVNLGLPENMVVVGIGGISTNVYGSNDENALNFSLSKTISVPTEGEFVIDGVSGSAAFEIFYQTDGSLEQAYIVGTKDISKGITITAGEDELSFLVDGVNYNITIPEGSYTAEEFKEILNQQLQAVPVPLNAAIEQGKVKLVHKKMGEHEIRDVFGSATTNVFFSENGKKVPDSKGYVKLSSAENDKIELDKVVLNTCSMKINSICISGEKYAKKALERLEKALQYVSSIRSMFGSTQNRLEHAIRSNENKEENLQYSESVIRDTDMAKQMVALSGHNIIQQAGQSMLAQANQLPEGVLALLR